MLRGLMTGIATLIVVGCGPSLRRVQDSRVYFERCYAADFDARIPVTEKHACWTSWLQHYTVGQPPERSTYARQRLSAMEHGEPMPLLPGLPEAAIGPATAAPITASSGSERLAEEATEPPSFPDTVDEEVIEPPTPRPRRLSPMPQTSNAECAARACEAPWRACVERCPAHRDACQTACEVELNACARGCF